MISTKANAVSAPTPGCVMQAPRHGTLLYFLLDGSRQLGDRSASVGRATPADRAAAGSPTELTGTIPVALRPASRHNLFLQRSPSFSATACSWFMIRVRACTMRCRCHSSCRRSRFSQLGTQICGKSSFSINRSNQLRILAIRLLLAHPLRADLRCIPNPQLKLQLPRAIVQTSARVRWPPSPHAPCSLAPERA